MLVSVEQNRKRCNRLLVVFWKCYASAQMVPDVVVCRRQACCVFLLLVVFAMCYVGGILLDLW